MSRSCFVCTTPYQIIASFTIAYYEKSISDIVIIPQFQNAYLYAKRIYETKVFNKEIVSDFEKINRYKKNKFKWMVWAGILNNYLRVQKTIPFYLGNTSYSTIFISSQAIVGRLISLYFQKKGAEIIFFDDGEGSYDDYKIYETQVIDRYIRKLLFGRQSIKLSYKRKLYCPELYEMTFGKYNSISAIPNWSKDRMLLNKINFISGYSDDIEISHKYVLLDTIPDEVFNLEEQKKYQKFIEICMDLLGEELLIKKHPRDNRKYKNSGAVYQQTSIPFEVICANSNLENKVLIAASSSAVLMPKLLFDMEPVVILLHHITGMRLGEEEKREIIISYIKNMYRDKTKFIVPETLEEFIEIIKMLKNKGGI